METKAKCVPFCLYELVDTQGPNALGLLSLEPHLMRAGFFHFGTHDILVQSFFVVGED